MGRGRRPVEGSSPEPLRPSGQPARLGGGGNGGGGAECARAEEQRREGESGEERFFRVWLPVCTIQNLQDS